MRKILVLQLARLGDIIQTLPTIQGLKRAYPQAEITLVTRSTFADASRLCPHVDKLVEFPTADIIGGLVKKRTSAAERVRALTALKSWITSNFKTEYDLLLNLTFSTASSYLAAIVPAKEKRGMVRGANGALVVADPWSQYFMAQVLTRNMNVLHLNDIFMRIAGVDTGAWPLELRKIATSSNPVIPPPRGMRRIGIQLTASTGDKTLNIPTWGVVCKTLLETFHDAEFVFFGSQGDVPAIRMVLDEAEHLYTSGTWPAWRCVVLAGTMAFHENAAWLRTCQWVVSPDTAIVHLASAVKGSGTQPRVLELAIGDVRPEETGPYGDGHVVLYPARGGAVELSQEIGRVLAGQSAKANAAQSQTQLVKRNDGTLRNQLSPRNFTEEENAAFFKTAYYLLAEFRCAGRVEDVAIPRLGDPNQKNATKNLLNAFDGICATTRLAEFGQHYCFEMLKVLDHPTELKALMGRLGEVEAGLRGLQKSVPLLRPLIDTWSVAKEFAPANSSGITGDLETMIALTEGTYRELKQNCEIIQQLLNTAVQEAQKKLDAKAGELSKGKNPEHIQGEGL